MKAPAGATAGGTKKKRRKLASALPLSLLGLECDAQQRRAGIARPRRSPPTLTRRPCAPPPPRRRPLQARPL
jgi:hypothetical protein